MSTGICMKLHPHSISYLYSVLIDTQSLRGWLERHQPPMSPCRVEDVWGLWLKWQTSKRWKHVHLSPCITELFIPPTCFTDEWRVTKKGRLAEGEKKRFAADTEVVPMSIAFLLDLHYFLKAAINSFFTIVHCNFSHSMPLSNDWWP